MKNLRKVLLAVVGAIIALNLAAILFAWLPGINVGGPLPTCGVEAEGSPTGWPFSAFIPGCSNGKGAAFIADGVTDLLIAVVLVVGGWYFIRRQMRKQRV